MKEVTSKESSPSPLSSIEHQNKIKNRKTLESEYTNENIILRTLVYQPLKFLLTSLIKVSKSRPSHVSFIMDGNRRFAKNKNIKVEQSHDIGFLTMCKILNLLYDCGVTTVTVFAFSIENFSRSRTEIDNLMLLAKKRLIQLTDNTDMCNKFGVRVKVLGDIKLLDEELQEMVRYIESETSQNHTSLLNVCFPYTGRWEIYSSMKQAIIDYKADKINDITIDTMDEYIYNHGNKATPPVDWSKVGPLDLLIRTSGVYRLSDYQLWQVDSSDKRVNDDQQVHANRMHFEFLNVLWPDLTIWKVIWILIFYCYSH
ncbi:hypothetical protein ACO0R3_000704 [Hanseniaspora guilliermondii]